jgi:uncharacterized membrane protein YfcA
MFVGAIVASTTGFGMGMTASPFLLLVLEPRTVVVIVNVLGLALFSIVLFQSRRDLPFREMVVIGAAGLAGTPVGVFVLSALSATVLRIGISVLIMLTAVAVVTNAGAVLGKSRRLGPPVGFLVGAMVSGFGIGGPLLVLYLLDRGWSRQVMRASLSFFFLLNMSTGVVGYGVAGLYTKERVALMLIVAPLVLAGFWLGGILLRRLDERTFRRGVIAVILFTSTTILARELLGLST